MARYLVVHNKHEGCYDYHCFEDHENKRRLTSITINPPKLFMFHDKEQAHDFFNEYIAEVDVVDLNCKDGDEVEHVDYCTCGIVEIDDEENPILFYNKRNQIFFLEIGAQVFLPPQNTKSNIDDMNLTNRLIRRCRHLDVEQKQKYIELGRTCEESMKKTQLEKDKEPSKVEVKIEPINHPPPVDTKPSHTEPSHTEPSHTTSVNIELKINAESPKEKDKKKTKEKVKDPAKENSKISKPKISKPKYKKATDSV